MEKHGEQRKGTVNAMSCNATRQFLLDTGWDAGKRRQAAEFLRHLEQCEVCQSAMEDFDVLRGTLLPVQPPEPAGGWDAMRRRIASPIPQQRLSSPHWFRAGLMIAASVLVAVGVFWVGRQTVVPPTIVITPEGTRPNHVKVSDPSTEPVEMPISQGDVSHEVQAFRQVSKVYDGHAGWMMVSQNSSDVGMVSDPASQSKRVLVLRLDLWHGKELVSNSDLLVLAGQKADLTVPLQSGQSLHYRIGTSTGEPTQLTLWLELKTPAGGEPLAALSTNVQMRRGQKLTAGKFATSAGEYELKIDFASTELTDNKP